MKKQTMTVELPRIKVRMGVIHSRVERDRSKYSRKTKHRGRIDC